MILREKPITSAEVEEAWQAFQALQMLTRERPEFLQNEYFMALHDTAFARFMLTFEAME